MGAYSPILTNAGAAKIAAARANGTEIRYKYFAVGDANGVSNPPSATQTALVHEVWREEITELTGAVYVHPNNANWTVCEIRIPIDVGGFEIREAGVFAEDGTLLAVSRYPTTTKPAPGSGSEKDVLVRMIFEVANAADVTHVIESSLMWTTKEYVDARIRHVRLATTANITLSGTQTIDGVSAVVGDRVLAQTQNDAKTNGVYSVSTGTWTRALDFNTNENILPTALITVSEGATHKDTVWMLTNDSIALGTTPLAFVKILPDESQRTIIDTEAPTGNTATPTKLWSWLANMIKGITGKSNWRTAPAITLETTKAHVDAANPHSGSAPLASPALTGTPTAPTAPVATNTTQIATTAFVKAVVAALVDSSPTTLDTLNELAAALGDDPNFATTMATALAAKAPLASPALTGTPTAPTAPVATNTTQIATTAFVQSEIAADRPFEPTASNIKMNGTASVGSLDTVPRGDHVHPTDTSRAPTASPSFTGYPTAPTQSSSDNNTRIATTAWVRNSMAIIATALGFVFVIGSTGYIKFPSYLGGFLWQWGYGVPNASGNLVGTLPVAFPNTHFVGFCATYSEGTPYCAVTTYSLTATSYDFRVRMLNQAATQQPLFWFAIGH